jgi:hypothetical protein
MAAFDRYAGRVVLRALLAAWIVPAMIQEPMMARGRFLFQQP